MRAKVIRWLEGFLSEPMKGDLLHFLLQTLDNSCVNVDKRVQAISKNFESKPQPEQLVSRTPSFSKRNQKSDEKEKEKERSAKEEEKESEDMLNKGKKNASTTPVESQERNQSNIMSGNGSVSNSQKGKPAGILTGLFTGNPASLVKGKEFPTVRSLPEILQYFTVHGLENESNSTGSNELEFYMVIT